MAEKKRQCGTCRFFVEKEASGHGKCTHPKRAGTDAELLLLRPTELACRTQWGDSLWQDQEDDSDPMEPKSPQQPSLPDPIAAQLQFDDEVTSVSIAGSKTSRSSFDDDVVDSGATASGMASWNDPVQDERLDLLRKGSHDALAGARKRHMEKKARKRKLIPFAEEDENGAPKSEPAPEPQQKSEPQETEEPLTPSTERAEHERMFPPDDFVEEEKTAAEKDDGSFDDEMVDESFSPDQHRSPRLRKLMREQKSPKRNEAMRMNVPSDMRVTSNNPDNREQWNSVPTLNPGFELPLNKPKEKPNSSPIKVAASAAPVATSSHQARPVSQARELVYEDRLRQKRAQRQLVAPIVDDEAKKPDAQPLRSRQPEPEVQSTYERPRLTEAPAQNTNRLERIKSSPLRGYHPVARKMAAPTHEEPARTQQEPRYTEDRPQRQVAPEPAPRRAEPQRQYDSAPQLAPRPRLQQQPQRDEYEYRVRQDERQVQPRYQEPEPIYEDDYLDQHEPAQYYAEDRRRPKVHLRDVNTPFKHQRIEISPEVPRRCGTCASFQPGGANGRGSCTNRFAGPVQRVVDEDDLACQHLYGSLWIPADEEVWLDELQKDYPPTPRVDAMLARRKRRAPTVLPDLDELTS